jgi:hypothetical protein
MKKVSIWRYFLIVCIIVQFSGLIAQTATVGVRVMDAMSGRYVESALVEVYKNGVFVDSSRSNHSDPVEFELSVAPTFIAGDNKPSVNNTHILIGDGYPNPASNEVSFEIYFEKYTDELDVTIYNILGQRVSASKVFSLSPDNYRLTIDASSLANSMYFIELRTSKGESVTGKFVKMGNYSFHSIPTATFARSDKSVLKNRLDKKQNMDKMNGPEDEYQFRVFADKSAQFNDPEDGWVGIFGYADETIEITGDISFTLQIDVNYLAPKADVAPTIDGVGNEACWVDAVWAPMDHLWLYADPTAEDFSGQYKIVWTAEKLYYLFEITDDELSDVHSNPTDNYWNDDCLELFIDEDNSGGWHTYNYNAFAYHISIYYDVVDTDGLYNDNIEIMRVDQGNNKYVWEMGVDIYDDTYEYGGDNTPVTLTAGKKIGFATAYCDNDGGDFRESFIGSVFIDGDLESEEKNTAWQNADVFAVMELVEQ